MHLCCKCKVIKPLTEFYKNKSRKSGYNGMCKICNNTYLKTYHYKNMGEYRKRDKIAMMKSIAIKQNYTYDYLRNHPCTVCGESDPVVLQFDHLRDKSRTISSLVGKRGILQPLIDEIAKCQILCANCHQRKTAKERGWFRFVNSVV